MDLSDTLRKYRQHNQITQQQLAQKLHVSRKTVSNWENDRSEPDYSLLIQICNIYGISTDDLLKERRADHHHDSKFKLNFINSWKIFSKNLFRINRPASRKEYDYIMIPLIIISFIIAMVSIFLYAIGMANDELTNATVGLLLSMTPSFLLSIIQFCLVARRNQDIGVNRWLAVIIFVPTIGEFYKLILLFLPSNFLSSNNKD